MATASRARKLLRAVFALVGAIAFAFLAVSLFVGLRYRGRIHSTSDTPKAPTAIVFGAGLKPNNHEPGPVLAERLEAAIALYKAGKVQKLLLTGDNSERYHDETKVMARYVVGKGVAATDVISDYHGVSTYDSCKRAQEVFGVDRALLVTQRFHLPRALFIANGLGIDSHGVAADGEGDGVSPYLLRELISRPVALAMVLLRPEPKFAANQPGE
jgi:vancomycin permeability regulator SanA